MSNAIRNYIQQWGSWAAAGSPPQRTSIILVRPDRWSLRLFSHIRWSLAGFRWAAMPTSSSLGLPMELSTLMFIMTQGQIDSRVQMYRPSWTWRWELSRSPCQGRMNNLWQRATVLLFSESQFHGRICEARVMGLDVAVGWWYHLVALGITRS